MLFATAGTAALSCCQPHLASGVLSIAAPARSQLTCGTARAVLRPANRTSQPADTMTASDRQRPARHGWRHCSHRSRAGLREQRVSAVPDGKAAGALRRCSCSASLSRVSSQCACLLLLPTRCLQLNCSCIHSCCIALSDLDLQATAHAWPAAGDVLLVHSRRTDWLTEGLCCRLPQPSSRSSSPLPCQC